MIDKIEIRERGPVGRGMAKAMNAAMKEAWYDTAIDFHRVYIPKRFTAQHGREAGYSPRQGQNYETGAKGFFRTYFGRKLRRKGHGDPFVWTGETRRNAQVATISSTSKTGVVRLPSAKRLNFHPVYAAEFRRITKPEAKEIAGIYDSHLSERIVTKDELFTTVIRP